MLAALVGVIWLARNGQRSAGAWAASVAGLVALGAGLNTVTWSLGRQRAGVTGERFRQVLGASAVLWAVGQLITAQQVWEDPIRRFGLGDLTSTLAMPLTIAALLMVPRRSLTGLPGARLVLDAGFTALAVTGLVWRLIFWPQPAGTGHLDAVGTVINCYIDLIVVFLLLLVWLRDRPAGALVLVAGTVLQTAADLANLQVLTHGDPVRVDSGVLWCLAWPILALGVRRFHPVTEHPDRLMPETGETRAAAASTLIAGAAILGSMILDLVQPGASIATGLYLAAVVLFVLRDLSNDWVRSALVVTLRADALRDGLTGLPNRQALTARIAALEASRPWVVVTVDLDGFKGVNDLLGYAAGDALIVQMGAVLRAECPAEGLVARLGGDEFAVLVPGSLSVGERLGGRLVALLRDVLISHGGGVALSASAGVGRVLPGTGVEQHTDRLTGLVESATALTSAKANGRDQVAVYLGAVEQIRQRRMVLERRLREAVAAGHLQMYAQPLVDLVSGEVRGFESLARWEDAELGVVSPAEFIPVAEQTSLVVALGEHALRRTLEEVIAGGVLAYDVEIGVNVSPIQLRCPRFAPMVIEVISDLGIPANRLTLEVTEAILIDEHDPASGALARLATAGVKLAIDDFGTGYSALGYLRRLPVDMIKIDRSWVVASVTEPRTLDIVTGVVALAHTLGATVVMEGVEDLETARVCRDLGAELGQGWLFGRPQPWPAAARELATGRPLLPQRSLRTSRGPGR